MLSSFVGDNEGPTNLTGYAHPLYAASLAEFGEPRHLPRCNGWILKRPIPHSPWRDAMGCYPRFDCQDWSQLPADLEEVRRDLVSLTIVPVPFGIDRSLLNTCFTHVTHFKNHFVADMSRPLNEIVKRSHRATVRRAVKRVEVRVCANPSDRLDQWVELFGCLARRHQISGLRAFSREAFKKQLGIPGIVAFEAYAGDAIVGMDLWYVQGTVAYGHLAAFSGEGYRLRAAYATKWHLINYFLDRVRWIDFGAGAGLQNSAADGLTRFKQGWSTGTQTVYLCGRVFQPEAYQRLVSESNADPKRSYFPAYRQGEFE